VPAHLTRTGVLEYRNPDGSVRRELRIPSEVFDSASLATLEDAPVTNEHQGMVTAEDYHSKAAGHVSGSPRADGGRISANLVIQDATLIADIDVGSKREVSCGYHCKLDHSPGTYEGAPYDCIQREIRYNHVAIVPRGRAGSDVALRLDSAGDQIVGETMKITFAGREYDLADTAQRAAYDAAVVALQSRADRAEGERDAARAEVATLKAAPAVDTARLDALVAERTALVASARKILGEGYSPTGKTNRQIKEDALRAADASVDLKDRADAYIDGRFDGLSPSPLANASAAIVAVSSGGHGIAVQTPANATPALPAWKQPLAATSIRK
jgi:uncharacterized protein